MTVQQSIPMLPVAEAMARFDRGPVPARPYYDPEWWELERKAIFLRTWLHIGHVCEIPEAGSFIRRDVEFARASLLVVRGKDGAVRTFHNVCTHRGTQLVEEAAGKRGQFSCRYHMWTFGTDGTLLSAPDFERFHVARRDCALKAVRTEVVAGMIFINFDPEPKQTAREFLGPVAEELELLPVARATRFTEWTYEIGANWKTHFDNFQENYHLRFIHPRTGEQAIGPENPFGYPTHYGFLGPHRSQRLWRNPEPSPVPPTLLLGYGIAARSGGEPTFPKTDFKLFPCLHVVGLPPAQQFTHTHWPLGPDRTRSVVRMYWAEEADSASTAFFRELAAMSIRDVLAEDRLAVEAGQRGLAMGALDQVRFQDHEILLRHQYETVQAKVAEYLAERAEAPR
jgi:phenylpropionate dioxygenase-like ring-hydroxylating dioxygenase large terminal subunit